ASIGATRTMERRGGVVGTEASRPMTAAVHLLCGPAGSGKTGQLLGRLHAWARRVPGSALWLGPARRGVEDLRGRLLQGLPGLWGFRLCTFHDLGEELLREEDPLARTLSDVQ